MGVRRSRLLDRFGFLHGFADRTGGVSAPPFDTLNLGRDLDDNEAAVSENRQRFASALGVATDRLFEQRQVHGVEPREGLADDRVGRTLDLEGDALFTRVAGVAVSARTADCVPLLLAEPRSGHVAAVHAGWRGAVAGVVPNTIEAFGHDPASLIVAIGPHIRVAAFEIGEEVAREMDRAAGDASVVDRRSDKPHGNLLALVHGQLRRAGVPEDAIDDVGDCTHADAAHFFSHRRDHGVTGRHLSAIVARGPA